MGLTEVNKEFPVEDDSERVSQFCDPNMMMYNGWWNNSSQLGKSSYRHEILSMRYADSISEFYV